MVAPDVGHQVPNDEGVRGFRPPRAKLTPRLFVRAIMVPTQHRIHVLRNCFAVLVLAYDNISNNIIATATMLALPSTRRRDATLAVAVLFPT